MKNILELVVQKFSPMKNTHFTFYELLKTNRAYQLALLFMLCCFFLMPSVNAEQFGEKIIEGEKVENTFFDNGIEIQEDAKGKFIEIYNAPFLVETEKTISSKLMNNKKVKEVIVNKSDKLITIYFSKKLSNAEIKDFARIYFNK